MILLISATAMFIPVIKAVSADISPEEVRKAIDAGVRYLKDQQQKDGSLGSFNGDATGLTGLCTLAMLNAGVPADDPVIQNALSFLQKQRPKRNYATSLQTMVFAQADPKRFRPDILRNVAWFEQAQVQAGAFRGSWSYSSGDDKGDNSNSQFALLALHEAERVGIRVSDRTWKLAQEYWQRVQNDDGSFGYRPDSRGARGSMTCAGIASLVIASGRVQEGDAQVRGEQILCCQANESDTDRIERALQWLARNFAVTHNPGASGGIWKYYYLYCLERVGRLTARRFIGDHDWYREGTAVLLASKGALTNYWQGIGHDESDPRIATSMALLFLAKGRRPVLLSKLRHGPEEQWNQHRADVNNLTRYVESRWDLDLTWQVIDIRAAKVDDLMQSPVLYFCGDDNPMPGSEAGVEDVAKKLRGYIDRGGFLFAEAYCAGQEFDRGFRQLITRIFPEPEYRLRLLPPEHSIWRTEEMVDPEYMRPIYGIDFGCRTSVVYCPPAKPGVLRPSLSCLWELSRAGRDMKYAESVAEHVQAGLSTGVNILAYATNRELKAKDEVPAHLQLTVDNDPFQRGRIRIANLRHPGGCDAAPRALVNLMETAAIQLKLRTAAESEPLSMTGEAIFNYPVVFMHGRNRFFLTDSERKQLKTYLERGGLLMANAICASEAFANSFRREMEAMFPDHPLESIPSNHPMLTPEYGGFDLSTVTRRDPQERGSGKRMEDILREVPPDLEGIRFGDRYGVIFSRFDLSCALEKQNSLECRGYIREDAAKIGLNILLYSLQQ
jgi:prenyltransferase beta subunit